MNHSVLARPVLNRLLATLLIAAAPSAFAGQDGVAQLHERVQSGTSELSEVDWSAHWIGARALAEMRYANLGKLVRSGATELARVEWRLESTSLMAEAGAAQRLEPQLARYGVTEFLHVVPTVQMAEAMPSRR